MSERARIGLVDVGSNSVKLLVADVGDDGMRQVDFASRTTRLGEHVPGTGRIGPEAARRTADEVAALVRRARRRRARVFAVGTDALRSATDAEAALRTIERRAGVPVRVLSAGEEARLVWEGARDALRLGDRSDVVLFDLGGGSCEFVRVLDGVVRDISSRLIGALRLTRRFDPGDPIDRERFRSIEIAVDQSLAKWRARIDPFAPVTRKTTLVASGGAVTAFVDALVPPRGPRDVIERARVHALLERCLELPLARRRRLRGIPPDRAEIAPAGLYAVRAIFDATGKRRARVYTGGVREGAIRFLWRNNFEWPRKIAARVQRWEASRRA